MFPVLDTICVRGGLLKVRHFCIDTDAEAVRGILLVNFSSPGSRPGISKDYLGELYTKQANTHAFTAWYGEECLFVLELHRAKYYDLPGALRAGAYDWAVELFAARYPFVGDKLYSDGMAGCVEFAFRDPAIRQLVAPLEYSCQSQWEQDLLVSVGFTRWAEGSILAGKQVLRLKAAGNSTNHLTVCF